MHPIIFNFGPFSLHSYGLAMAVAFAMGIWVAVKRAERRGFGGKFALDIAMLILVFSLVGARFLYVVTHWSEFADHPFDIISPVQSNGQIGISGLVLLGGVLAAFATVFIFSRRKGYSFFSITDLLIPSTALGIAIGRIGCFFNGCCFGEPTALPWCVVFPEGSLAGYVYPQTCIHPTQLYEALYMLVVFAALLLYDRKPRATGLLTGIFLAAYGVGRFFIESLRWYENEMILLQSGTVRVTISQIISAAMVVCGIALILRSRGQKPSALSLPTPPKA